MREFSTRFPVDIQVNDRLRYVASGPYEKVLNVGSGINPIKGAVNWDLKPNAPLVDVVGTIIEQWPFADGTFDLIVSFHCIEHIPGDDALHFFTEALRVLRLAGTLIVECPDIVGMCQEVVDGNLGALRQIYGGSSAAEDHHLWGYDRSSLMALAKAAGFGAYWTGVGTDYHSIQVPTVRLEAVKVVGAVRTLPRG